MSWLSDLSRSVTGRGVGENIGYGTGYVVSGGNPVAAETGARIGGISVLELIMTGQRDKQQLVV